MGRIGCIALFVCIGFLAIMLSGPTGFSAEVEDFFAVLFASGSVVSCGLILAAIIGVLIAIFRSISPR